VRTCPVCSNEAARCVHCAYPGYREPELYDIYECDVCGTSYAVGDVTCLGEIYEAIYRQIDEVPGYRRYAQFARTVAGCASPLDMLAEQELTYYGIRKFLRDRVDKEKVSILEVGSGLGYLTFALDAAGYRVKGLDIAQAAVDAACERYGQHYLCGDIAEYAAHHPHSHDVVIATEVIEHLAQLYPFVKACLRVVKPGGFLIFSTPNRAAHASVVPWAVEGPPVHLSWFSKTSLETLARKTECEVEFLDVSDHPGADGWIISDDVSTKLAVLNCEGRVIKEHHDSRSPATRVISRVKRLFGCQSAANPVAKPLPGTPRECPTLFAILSKQGR